MLLTFQTLNFTHSTIKETQLISSLWERVRNLDCSFLIRKEYPRFFLIKKITFILIYSINQTVFNKWKGCSILSVRCERLNLLWKSPCFHPIDLGMWDRADSSRQIRKGSFYPHWYVSSISSKEVGENKIVISHPCKKLWNSLMPHFILPLNWLCWFLWVEAWETTPCSKGIAAIFMLQKAPAI